MSAIHEISLETTSSIETTRSLPTLKEIGSVSIQATHESQSTTHEVEHDDEQKYVELGNALSRTIDGQLSEDVSNEELTRFVEDVTQYAKDAVATTLPEAITEDIPTETRKFDGDISTERSILRPLIDKLEEDGESCEKVTPDKVRLIGMAWDESGREPELEASLILMTSVLQKSEEFKLEGDAAAQAMDLVKLRTITGQVLKSGVPEIDGFNTYYETIYQALVEAEKTDTLSRAHLEGSLSVLNRFEHTENADPKHLQLTAEAVVQDALNIVARFNHSVKDNHFSDANSLKNGNVGVMLIEAIRTARVYNTESVSEEVLLEGARNFISSLHQQSIANESNELRSAFKELTFVLNTYMKSGKRIDLRTALDLSVLPNKRDFHIEPKERTTPDYRTLIDEPEDYRTLPLDESYYLSGEDQDSAA